MPTPSYKICFFGVQGSGKGTQAARLQTLLHLPHIAPGDIFRSAVAAEDDLGKTVGTIINAGRLVPDEITNTLVRKRLRKTDAVHGFILDGYPRNIAQADALDAMTTLTHIVVITITAEESVRRLSLRRVCSACGHTTTLQRDNENQHCPRCGAVLIHRDDDKPKAIRHRLQIYHTQTEPLLARYEARGIVHRIDGMGSIDNVWERVSSLFFHVRAD